MGLTIAVAKGLTYKDSPIDKYQGFAATHKIIQANHSTTTIANPTENVAVERVELDNGPHKLKAQPMQFTTPSVRTSQQMH